MTITSENLEADVTQFADREIDVALALSICSLNRRHDHLAQKNMHVVPRNATPPCPKHG